MQPLPALRSWPPSGFSLLSARTTNVSSAWLSAGAFGFEFPADDRSYHFSSGVCFYIVYYFLVCFIQTFLNVFLVGSIIYFVFKFYCTN